MAFVLTSMAQARFSSNTETVNLGQVCWKQPAEAKFIITNTGNKPLVITDVQTDCDCSVPVWTRQPIAPGRKGEISIRFDARQMGHFLKNVAVYCNAEPHLIYLKFDGSVVEKITDYAQLNYTRIGDVAIEKSTLDFPDVHKGDVSTMELGVINLSDHPYEPVLMHLPPYIKMTRNPAVLQKGEKGTITLKLDAGKLHGMGLTQTSLYLARFPGDKVSDENEIPLNVVLLPDFSKLSQYELSRAADIKLSANQIDFSEILKRKRKASQYIFVTNTGKSPLHIGALQVFHPAVSVKLKKNVLQPGETAKLKVMLDSRLIGKRRSHLRLLIITNSPAHPKELIDLKAK